MTWFGNLFSSPPRLPTQRCTDCGASSHEPERRYIPEYTCTLCWAGRVAETERQTRRRLAEDAVDRAWDGYIPSAAMPEEPRIFIPTSSRLGEYYP